MHFFKYSPREGTKAAIMEEQVDGNRKEIRSNKLIEMSNKNEKDDNEKYLGKKLFVLFEEKDGEYIKGHTTNYKVVKVKTEDIQIENEIKEVEIIGEDGLELIGCMKEEKE